MKYKIEHQFQFILIAFIISVIYLSNLILIKLPFFSINFPEKDFTSGITSMLLSFFPNISIEFQIYNIQILVIWACSIIFGSIKCLISVLLYLLFGFINIPVFAGGGGITYINEPTFGYLISFPLLAYFSGYLFKKNNKFTSVLVPIFFTHLIGILYLFLFKQSYLHLAWYMSFSMIGYDMLFAFILLPFLPLVSFILNELFIQEVPVRSLVDSEEQDTKKRWKIKRNPYESNR